MSPNRSGALNPKSFDRDEPQSFARLEPSVVRPVSTLGRFSVWMANLHPGTLLYCGYFFTLQYCFIQSTIFDPCFLLYGANRPLCIFVNTKKAGDFLQSRLSGSSFLLNYIHLFAPGANYINSFFRRRGCFKQQFAAKFASVINHFLKLLKLHNPPPNG